MYDPGIPVYVTDAHALFWYRQGPSQLSPAADTVFRLAYAGGARILVTAIVIAEQYYLTRKIGAVQTPFRLLEGINTSRELVFLEMGQADLEKVNGAPEMHDRLICAAALAQDAAIITKDETLRKSGEVKTIW